jgi:hypothetical protein
MHGQPHNPAVTTAAPAAGRFFYAFSYRAWRFS